MTDPVREYKSRYEGFLRTIAHNLEDHIRSHLEGIRNIDRVTARAKDPERFAEKARRLDDNGHPKYARPLTDIQDQLGARIIVFYLDDVKAVTATITQYFQPVEQRELVPESEWEF